MAEKISLIVKPRKTTGRKVKRLRREGLLPANIFGKKTTSLAIEVSADKFEKIFSKAGETSIIHLEVEGEKEPRPVLVSNLHRHPVTDAILHVDFHQVDLTEKVTATIPVELVGESSAEKDFGAVIVQSVTELDVEALPTDLPEKIEVKLTTLKEIGSSLTVADLKVDADKIRIIAEPETVIVQAQEPQKEEEVVVAPVAEEAAVTGEVSTETKPEETPAKEEAPKA